MRITRYTKYHSHAGLMETIIRNVEIGSAIQGLNGGFELKMQMQKIIKVAKKITELTMSQTFLLRSERSTSMIAETDRDSMILTTAKKRTLNPVISVATARSFSSAWMAGSTSHSMML